MLKCKLVSRDPLVDNMVFYTESISFAIRINNTFGGYLYIYDYKKDDWDLYHFKIEED